MMHPLFLIGLVAVAIPIAVHLFNFRRYKKVYFSNVEYLEQLQTETRKQSRLREYLILAARILAVVFLVLAFAQPYIPNKKNKLKEGGCAISVYIDNSYSMENTGSEASLLEMAKEKAREIVAAYRPSDQFQLLSNDAPGSQFRWLSRDEFLSSLDELETTSAAPRMSEIAAKQHDFLSQSAAENKLAYVVSDFQSSTADLDAYPNDSLIATTFVHLEAAAVDNISIDSVLFSSPVFLKGSQVVATVYISNHGSQTLESLPVKLYCDDKERAIASVDIPSEGVQSVEIPFTIENSGVLNCRIETTDYPITFDDRFYFSLNVSERLSMLVVEGREQPYAKKLFEGDSLVVYHSSTDRNIDFKSLPDHNFILLNELQTIPSGLAQTLQSFVESGGSLLIVPALDADVSSYNQALQALHAPQLGTLVQHPAKASDINLQASLYKGVFAGNVGENVELPTVQKYFKTTTTAASVVEPAIVLATGDAYLTCTPCGSGKVYLIASPLQTEQTDFVQQALFVPTLYNMALYSQSIGQTYTIMGNNNPVLLPAGIRSTEGTLRLTLPGTSFECIPDLRQSNGRTYLYPHNQVSEAGCYSITPADGKEVLGGLAFNYSRLESDMHFLSRNLVEKLVDDNHLGNCSVVKNSSKPLDQYIRSQYENRPLWRWCVALCLLMLAAEIVLLKWWKEGKSKPE